MHLKILVTAGDGIGPEVTLEAENVLQEVLQLSGHTFSLESAPTIGGVAISRIRYSAAQGHAGCGTRHSMPFSSALWVATNSIPFPPTNVPKQACCSCAPLSVDSPTFAPPSHSKN